MRFNKTTLTAITLFNILFLVIGANINTTTAQTTQTDPLTWGVKAGVNAADLYGDDVSSSDTRAGFNGGLFVNYRFSKMFGVQPEVLFTQKGGDLSNGLAENGTTEYSLNYLEIPVLAKFYIPTNSMLEPNIYVGPKVGFNLSGEANDTDIDDDLKNADFGLAFGAGLDFNMGPKRNMLKTVGLDVRYTLGLTDTFDLPNEPDVKNSVFTAAVTLGF